MIREVFSIDEFLSILSNADLSENAYLSYDYFCVYLKYFPVKNFICYCLYENDKCIGLLPLFKKGLVYEIVGYRASNYLGYICRRKDTQYVDNAISEHIKKHHPYVVIDYYDINTKSGLYDVLNSQTNVVKIPLYSCPFVDCNQDFDTLFVTQVTKAKKRSELRKFGKKLDVVGAVKLYNIDDVESWNKYGYLIRDIFALHSERFSDVYIPSDVCLHKNVDYYTELFKQLVIKGKALLSVLTVGDVTVSFLYTAVSEGIVMDWMPAFDPAFAKYNLGTVHLMKLLEFLCASDKYRILDFSKGAAVYKARWAKGETYNYMFVKAFSNNIISSIKTNSIVFPIRLKNKLRANGMLDKIKKCVVNFERLFEKPKKEDLNRKKEIKVLSYAPENSVLCEFDYKYIRECSIEDRKLVLDAIYNGDVPKLLLDDENVVVVLDKENVNEI